ncbi:MAG: DUF4270 domain-containing protein [Paludibacter sp.]|nr:DUF4270 domain-containing protein [Paludibacter sp.]
MKYNSFILFFVLSFLTVSCTDNLVDVGTGIQPTSDGITVGADTFHVSTQNVIIKSMSTKPDSFLLGAFYDAKYGSTQADILAQVEGPTGYKYPTGAVPDSVFLVMKCLSWFGDKYAPLDVNVYEMNKKTFNFTDNIPTDLNPSQYVDFADSKSWLGHNVITARHASVVSSDSIWKTIKLSDNFKNRFFDDTKYASEKTFKDFFGGVYIKVNFGTSALLNINTLYLESYYHYHVMRNGKDTILNGSLVFPANLNVRQVNRIVHPDTTAVIAKLNLKDSINYVSSPANIQTSIVVPLARMKQRMDAKILNKNLTMNNIVIKAEVTELDSSTYGQPRVASLMIMKDSELSEFFKNNEIPSGSNAAFGAYQEATTTTVPYYSFNIAKLIATEIKTAATNGTALPEYLTLRLVPVDVTYNSNNAITAVKQQNSMSAVTIRSGKNKVSPMRIHVVYSGF